MTSTLASNPADGGATEAASGFDLSRPLIPTANYHRDDVFRDEVARVFDANFQFVAMASELANDRDFVCVDYFGSAIVVQNFKGELRAFQNVCSHRFNRIQTEERGNRPLLCRYHGWSFDRTGFPAGLPKREQYLTTPDAAETLCLKPYRVEMCGPFVFVAKHAEGPDLCSYLGRFYDDLQTIGGHFGPASSFATTPHKANWKLLVENVLECYHCALVHPDTFIATLGVGRSPPDKFMFDGPHSSCHFPRVEGKKEHLRNKVLAHLDARPLAHLSFHHIYIYPNLFVSSTEGLSFYVGHALPLSPTETNLRVRLFEPQVELTSNQRVRQDVITQQGIAIGDKVIEEDRATLEDVQRGITIADTPGALGSDEVRIRAFMDAYTASMS